MFMLRVLLALIWLSIAGYTAAVIANHGIGLFPIFLGDIASIGWPGQFNFDFTCMLMLSGLWVAWRHRFSAAGLALGLAAFVGGAFFLSAYLLVVSVQTKGQIDELLMGRR